MKHAIYVAALVVAAVTCCAVPAIAGVPHLLAWQGVALDSTGFPVPDGSYSFTFAIFGTPTGGSPLWTETLNVTSQNGVLNLLLGGLVPIADSVFNDTLRYLEVKLGSDPPYSPRTRIVSVGFAYRVSSVDGASGGIITSKVSIGPGNVNTGTDAFVAGANNRARGSYSVVSGGGGPTSADSNFAGNSWSTVGGGQRNVSSGGHSTVGGGDSDTASSDNATVGGGERNSASGFDATVGGGQANRASGFQATVGGGIFNAATGDSATVSGGAFNAATSVAATVGGGVRNISSGFRSAIGGGGYNKARGTLSTVGGGGGVLESDSNSAQGYGATIAGGQKNMAGGDVSTVGGGNSNVATGFLSTIGGGNVNLASGAGSLVGGGSSNGATALGSAVGGGGDNAAIDTFCTVSGGSGNAAYGDYATVPGGRSNSAAGRYSFAAGRRALATAGSFVWADSTDADLTSSGTNTFNVRASGGTTFYSNSALSAGVTLAAGGGSWSSVSDRNLKENFHPADGAEILEKLAQLPVSTWNYKSQSHAIRHIGPMAQDFYRLFGVGEDNRHIATIDPDGIALAAIQELYKRTQEIEVLNQRLAQSEQDRHDAMAGFQAQLAALEVRVESLVATRSASVAPHPTTLSAVSSEAGGGR